MPSKPRRRSVCPCCSLIGDDDQWICRKGVKRLGCFSIRTVDRLDNDESEERTFPRSSRVKVPGAKRGFRRWEKRAVLDWLKRHQKP